MNRKAYLTKEINIEKSKLGIWCCDGLSGKQTKGNMGSSTPSGLVHSGDRGQRQQYFCVGEIRRRHTWGAHKWEIPQVLFSSLMRANIAHCIYIFTVIHFVWISPISSSISYSTVRILFYPLFSFSISSFVSPPFHLPFCVHLTIGINNCLISVHLRHHVPNKGTCIQVCSFSTH